MPKEKAYWQSLEGLSKGEAPSLKEDLGADLQEGEAPSRRDFLKLMGFSVAAVSLSACEAPVRKAIPYLHKPVDIDPGIANYYASTYFQGGKYNSVVVKTREGRPIKIERNPASDLSGGGTGLQAEASVLSLYDTQRARNPLKNGEKAHWDVLDEEVRQALSGISGRQGRIVLLSPTLISPCTQTILQTLVSGYPGMEHITYDAVSYAAALDANKDCFGIRAFPFYDFSKAEVIVSFGADFLGTWLHPTLFSHQFSRGRKLHRRQRRMSRLYAFESNLSLTGANADYRMPIRDSELQRYLHGLYHMLARALGAQVLEHASQIPEEGRSMLMRVAKELLQHQGKALVLCGHHDYTCQVLSNAINELLGAYSSGILDWEAPLYLRKGDDAALERFVDDLTKGRIDGLICYNCNPVYDHPRGAEIQTALSGLAFSLSTSGVVDETAMHCQYLAPDHHYLESWNDAEPRRGHYSFTQPVISPLFDTRQAQSSFLSWHGQAPDYYHYLVSYWKERLATEGTRSSHLQRAWDSLLHTGIYHSQGLPKADQAPVFSFDLSALSFEGPSSASPGSLELVLYESVTLGDGSAANNPWLQEMPDPLSKACWENYITLSIAHARQLGIRVEDNVTQKVMLKAGAEVFELPAVIQPGQAEGTVGLALGYGRSRAGKVGNGVGVRAAPLQVMQGAYRLLKGAGVQVEATGHAHPLALMQTQNTYVGRQTVIQETILPAYQKDASAGRYKPKVVTGKGPVKPSTMTLWKGHEYPNHHWGMVIDLNSCTGCQACVVACQAENNIPVVGKEEVARRREMHWLRIDRYYSSQGDVKDKSKKGLAKLEAAAANPEVVFQPMLCQHCNHAPCEAVCPVAATTHSSEGLNQMTYNRCIGTRYCANNCPYKVRRFNWFKYHDNIQFDTNTAMSNALGKMVLNPDVTVRSRGVMEKCSFCVQRIQAGKLKAKQAGRRIKDEDVRTACAGACPTQAITFGDLKNKDSAIARTLQLKANNEGDVEVQEERAYHVLEEINVRPNVWYLTKVKNKAEKA